MNSEEREILDLAAQNLQAAELLANKVSMVFLHHAVIMRCFTSLRRSYFGGDYISLNIQP